jgi:Flp pilus assembly pilin Flp
MKKLAQLVQQRLERRRDEGATAVEYALLIAFVAIVLIAGAVALAGGLNARFSDTCVQVSAELPNDCTVE